jgi:hypothetical protein
MSILLLDVSGYEVAKDFNPFMQDLTQKLQKVVIFIVSMTLCYARKEQQIIH